jgi:signal transduction histidine kinase/ActR/RegA family two-component response regulator
MILDKPIKNSHLKISTYSKVVSVLTIVSIGFLLLFSVLFYHSYQQYKLVVKVSTQQFESEANALVELNSDGYSSLINEITFWDELVNFIKTKNYNWFNNSLAYLVDTNKIDYIDAYTIDGEFVTKASTLKIKSSGFIPKGVFAQLKKNKTAHFYIRIPEGVVEVYGATVHLSEDPFKNKTAPQGFLFIAKLLDSSYFVNLEKVIGSKIDYTTKKFQTNDETIYFNKIINDFEGKEITSLTFARQNAVSFARTRNLLLILVLGFISSILIFLYYANKWTRKPMSLIKEVLETGDADAITALKRIRGEFSYIGKLFDENKTQRNQLNSALIKAEESDKLKSAFLMNISHEIRTPMNAIIGFSDLLLSDKTTATEKKEYVKIIQNSSKNLIDIIDDLVEMSRIDAQTIAANSTSCNLDKLVKSVFESIQVTNQNALVDLKLVQPENQLQQNIITDAVKLNQVLVNLMNNALKFTQEGFVVLDYEVNLEAKEINFSVKDSGIGISDDFKNKIFERFIKVNSKVITANDGMGLGLAISKSYVELLGGKITLQSEEGVGSVFSFTIPLKIDENTQNEDLILSSQIDFGNEEIVIVAEDDKINFLLIKKLLSNFNFKVLHAPNGAVAVQQCKMNSEIDLILMDIKMPLMDGYDAFVEIRKFNKTIPIIAQTSYSFQEEIDKINSLGFNDYIAKPLDKDKLFALVTKYMKKE